MERVETTQPTAGEKMHEASEVVSTKAGEAVDRGRGLVADQIGQRSTQLSDQIGSASETMRQVAEQARTEGNSQHARLADQAADRGERVRNILTRSSRSSCSPTSRTLRGGSRGLSRASACSLGSRWPDR